MKIAGELTIKDWEDLEKKLKTNYNNHWDDAYKYFEKRIYTRYVIPIKAIINVKPIEGEGFAIVNLQCPLIETIECFINGWIHENSYFKKTNGEKFKGNHKIFQDFFDKREPFINYKQKIDGNDFFKSVRCGLLHETQTRNNWKIRKETIDGESYKFDGEFKIIYRDNFQIDIEKLLLKYKDAIITGVEFDGISACGLRENFIAKMNHICKKSVAK